MKLCLGFFSLIMAAILLPVSVHAAISPVWTPEKQLTNEPGDVWYTAVAASGSTIHTARTGTSIFYKRSLDEGVTWQPEINLGSGILYLEDPLVAEGSNVFIVYLKDIRNINIGGRDWPAGNMYVRISRDNGVTWQPEVKLTNAGGAFRLSLSETGGKLYLTWMDFRSTTTSDVYFRRSLDNGSTWEPEKLLVTGTNSRGAGRPQLTASGDVIHLVWMDGRDNIPTCIIEEGKPISICTLVYYKRSLDGGNTWGPDIKLTEGPAYSGRPDVVMSGNTVLVGYDHVYDTTNQVDQVILRSTDNGTTWSQPQRLTNIPGDSTHGYLIMKDNIAHLAWFDSREAGNYEIYYRITTNGGLNWDAEERLTQATGNSTTPLQAVSSNYLFTMWGDTRTGTRQTWYRRRSLASLSNPIPSPSAATFKAGDVDRDGDVDIFDYNFVLSDFGATSGVGLRSDFNKNGRVDIFDFNTLISDFGK